MYTWSFMFRGYNHNGDILIITRNALANVYPFSRKVNDDANEKVHIHKPKIKCINLTNFSAINNFIPNVYEV